MQALILAGGEGTRLRPLTYTTPKPVMPLAGRPFLSFMLDWLRSHGVEEVILSCGFMSDGVKRVLGDIYDGMRLRYVIEEEPLGTAGPVRLAFDEGVLAERLLVLNGDVLTDMDLSAELAQHERTVVERIAAGRAVSFEREVFPALVGDGLFGFPAEGYWIDIGTPERYLRATWDLLSGRVKSALPPRDRGGSLRGPGSAAAPGARIGPLTVLGRDAWVGAGSTVERAVLHDGVHVGSGCYVGEAVLGEGVVVGDGARIGAFALVGSDARLDDGAVVAPGERVAPAERVGA